MNRFIAFACLSCWSSLACCCNLECSPARVGVAAAEAVRCGHDSPCDASAASNGLAAPNGYHLAWQDEFDDLTIAETSRSPRWSTYFRQWNVRHLSGNDDHGIKVADETVTLAKRPTATALREDGRWGDLPRFLHQASDGTLKLRAFPLRDDMRGEFWGFPYVASMICADFAPGQAYGYWEIRARINAIGKGQHIALWLLPDEPVWPPEVDILEVVGTNPTQFTATIHPTAGQSAPRLTYYTEPRSPDGFHVFGFEWTPKTMRWTVDGQVVREHGDYVGNRPMHFLASWEIGSRWPGKPDNTTPWPAEIEFDYIRVYK